MPDSFGHLVKKHRIAKGMTQYGLADALGIRQGRVSQIEKGWEQSPRSAGLAVRMAEILGGDADEFCLAAGVWPPDMDKARAEVVSMWRTRDAR